MSLRAYTDSVDDYNRTHTIEIHKDGYSGSVDYLKNTGSGYASFDYEKIDPKSPTDNPIQKGALEFSLWLQSSVLIDEIKTADEQTFWAVHKIDGTQEWIGYIYNDLSTYEEGFENHPFRITLMAKDFTDLGGKDYLVGGSLPDSRERVIATIAHLLDTVGFDMPIKTHTSWIEENLSGDYDYLNEIYHETKALREFGRTEDESDQSITVEDALTQLCNSHGLLLKQANGCYWIDQLTEYDDPLNVQEATYDLTGAQPSLTTGNDLTVDANTSDLKVTIHQDNRDNSGLPGLKRVKNKYAHRTKVTEIGDFAFALDDSTTTEDQQTQLILSDGNQRIEYTIAAGASRTNDAPSMTGRYVLKAGSYYWDNENYEWTENGGTELVNTFEMTQTTAKPGIFLWQGADAPPNVETALVPSDADGQLTIKAYNANPAEESNYGGRVRILNPQAEENSTSINYQLTQTGDYSVVNEIQDTWFGDGPVPYSVGALRYGTSDGDLTLDSWQFRGATPYRNFHENRLKEIMDTRRGWRRLLSATLKGLYYPYQILSYDSEYFYFIGGSWDLFTGNWEGELFSLDIQTGSDTFDDIPKFTEGEGSGTSSSTSSDTTTSGITQSFADSTYFKQSEALGELATADIDTALTNLGLKGGSRDLDLQSLISQTANTADGVMDTIAYQFSESRGWGYNEFNNRVFYNAAGSVPFWVDPSNAKFNVDTDIGGQISATSGDISGSFEASTLRPDTGKFLSPTSYAFRNAGDTGFRDVEMAGLTANGNITATRDGVGANIIIDADVDQQSSLLFYKDGALKWQNYVTTNSDTLRWLASGAVRMELSTTMLDLSVDAKINKADPIQYIQDSETTSGNAQAYTYYSDSDGSGNPEATWRIGYNNRNFVIGFDGDISSESFSDYFTINDTGDVFSGDFNNATWAGSGYRGTNVGDWVVENLRVRNALEVYEFVAKQISSVGGKEILSIANGRIESIDTGANTITVQDVRGQNATSFEAGDLWIVQVVDINNDLQSGGTGSIVRSVRGSVSSVSGETLTVSVNSGALSDLEENDLIVAYGSSNGSRNAIMYRNVDRSDDNLIMRVQTGVTSFGALTDPDNTRVAFGDLYGSAGTAYADYSSETFGFFAGDNTGDKVTIDATNGVRFLDGANNVGAQFNASKLTVGDGFEYDAPSNTLNVAAFTVNEHYLTNGNVYIGNDLNAQAPIGNANTIAIGNYSDGSLPIMRAVGSGGLASNYIQMRGADSSSTNMFFVRSNGNDVVQVSGDSAQFFGAFVDNTGLWAGGGATSNPSTKSDSNFWAKFDTGEFFYKAMGTTIHNAWAGGSGATIDDSYWTKSHSYSSTVTSDDPDDSDMFKVRFTKQFGENLVNVFAPINVDMSRSDTDVTFSFDVVITVSSISSSGSVSETTNVFSNVSPGAVVGYDSYSIDISSLDNDELYELTINFDTTIHINDTDSSNSSGNIDTELRKDVYVRTGTG